MTMNASNYYKRLEETYTDDDVEGLSKKCRAFKVIIGD
jgi:hypothetical protein